MVQNRYQKNRKYGVSSWGFPKGKTEPHENERSCAIRELREETGLRVPIRRGTRSVTFDATTYFPIIMDVTLADLDRDFVSSYEICNVDIVPIDMLQQNKRLTNKGLTLFASYPEKAITCVERDRKRCTF